MASPKDWPNKPDMQKNNNPNSILEEIKYRSPIAKAKIHEEFGSGTMALPEGSPENERITPRQVKTEENTNQSSLLEEIIAEIHVLQEYGNGKMASVKESPKEPDVLESNNPEIILEKNENKSPIDSAEIHEVHEEISTFATNYQNIIDRINNACSYLNEEIDPRIIQGSSSATLYLGKEAGSLIGSLKTLGEKILKEDCSSKDIKKNLVKATFDMSRCSQQMESLTAILENNVETLQSVMDYYSRDSEEDSVEKTPTSQENNSNNTASDISSFKSTDISSFKSTDIVTSSPFSSFDRNDEEPTVLEE